MLDYFQAAVTNALNSFLKLKLGALYAQNCSSLGQIKPLMGTAIGFKSLLAIELS